MKNKIIISLMSICTSIIILLSVAQSENLIDFGDIVKIHKQISAPAKYKVLFLTTKGEFMVEIDKSMSPLAADRLFQLVRSNYFNNIPIYRVVPNFVVQFGTLDGKLDSAWSKEIINDEPVKMSNLKGTLAFARAGKNSRGTQLFININNNSRLDTVSYGETLGFPPFGNVISGMEIVEILYNGYGNTILKQLDTLKGNIPEYVRNNYPKIDYIINAVIYE